MRKRYSGSVGLIPFAASTKATERLLLSAALQFLREQDPLCARKCRAHSLFRPFSDQAFDLINASLLFHETPQTVTKTILRESYRLLKRSGEIIISDGNQQGFWQVTWVDTLFYEPYLTEYASGSTDAWLGAAVLT
ncbi:MAG TPA: methyltransferase domain-containing protein [Leptolyngbyaceae cyanobacterium]